MKKLALCAILALLSTPNLAGENYVGVDFGRTNINRSYGDNYSGWNLYVGQRFHPHFAAEAGYRRLGQESVAGVNVRGGALQLSLLGFVPVSTDAQLFARLGANRVQIDARGNGVNAKEHESKVLYGFGVEYSLGKSLSLRTEYQRPTDDSGVSSLGLRLSF